MSGSGILFGGSACSEKSDLGDWQIWEESNPRVLDTSKVYLNRSVTDFCSASVVANLPFEAAPHIIRKTIRAYIGKPHQMVVHAEHYVPRQSLRSTVSAELEHAITESKSILSIDVNPDGSTISEPYLKATLDRAAKLLRTLADLFWDFDVASMPVPSITPADQGSIDLFWEYQGTTLLVNIPAEAAKAVTFFGKRGGSTLSGVLEPHDTKPKHLTGWLAGRD
jgi:hypothetical protein